MNDTIFSESVEARERRVWISLGKDARDVLAQLYEHGPTYDGHVVSKCGRDLLVKHGLAVKICRAHGEEGYQAMTYLGRRVYKCGQEYGKQS